jgi:hypothetical protein
LRDIEITAMQSDALNLWCDAIATLLDLPIERGDRAEIIANLRLIARQIAIVAEVTVDDFAEPAPIFRS